MLQDEQLGVPLDAAERLTRTSQLQIRANIRWSRRVSMTDHHPLPELPAWYQLKRVAGL